MKTANKALLLFIATLIGFFVSNYFAPSEKINIFSPDKTYSELTNYVHYFRFVYLGFVTSIFVIAACNFSKTNINFGLVFLIVAACIQSIIPLLRSHEIPYLSWHLLTDSCAYLFGALSVIGLSTIYSTGKTLIENKK